VIHGAPRFPVAHRTVQTGLLGRPTASKALCAKGTSRFLRTVGSKVGAMTFDLKRTVSPSAGTKQLASVRAGVAATLAATAAVSRRRGRHEHAEPPAPEPEAPAIV